MPQEPIDTLTFTGSNVDLGDLSLVPGSTIAFLDTSSPHLKLLGTSTVASDGSFSFTTTVPAADNPTNLEVIGRSLGGVIIEGLAPNSTNDTGIEGFFKVTETTTAGFAHTNNGGGNTHPGSVNNGGGSTHPGSAGPVAPSDITIGAAFALIGVTT